MWHSPFCARWLLSVSLLVSGSLASDPGVLASFAPPGSLFPSCSLGCRSAGSALPESFSFVPLSCLVSFFPLSCNFSDESVLFLSLSCVLALLPFSEVSLLCVSAGLFVFCFSSISSCLAFSSRSKIGCHGCQCNAACLTTSAVSHCTYAFSRE